MLTPEEIADLSGRLSTIEKSIVVKAAKESWNAHRATVAAREASQATKHNQSIWPALRALEESDKLVGSDQDDNQAFHTHRTIAAHHLNACEAHAAADRVEQLRAEGHDGDQYWYSPAHKKAFDAHVHARNEHMTAAGLLWQGRRQS